MPADDPHPTIDTEVNQDGRYPDAFDDSLCASGFTRGHITQTSSISNADKSQDVSVSIWSTPDSPAYPLGTVTLAVADDYVKVLVPRARLDQHSACPRYPNGYTVFATDAAGEPVYEGEVSHSVTRRASNGPGILLKCKPAELLD